MNELAKKQDIKQWRPIPQMDMYYIACEDGRIASTTRKTSGGRTIRGRVLKLQKTTSGYYFFQARTPFFSGSMLAHRAVLSAFTGGIKNMDVNHLDGNKINNALENLEWASRSENQLHAANAGLKPTGAQSHLSRLTEENVREIRRLLSEGVPQSRIALQHGVSQTAVSKIKTNKKWKQLA
jgi:hypothetical protein